MEAAAKAELADARERARKDREDVTIPASMARFLDAVRSGNAVGGLVAWTAGGRHLVGELVKFAGDAAIVARTVSGASARPEMKSVALDRLRPARADGPEADALATHHKYAEQQRKWLEWHDRQFETYCPTTYPDASYTKDFTLTAEPVLRTGRAYVVPDGLIRGGDCQIYMERVENRFGKVVQLRGYQVSRRESWPFVTRAHLPGQLPRYGTVIEGQDGKSYVVTSRHTWDIRSQLSPGERVRLKKTGEEQVIKGVAGRSQHSDVVYVLETGGMVLSLDTERVDTEGDRIVTAEDPQEISKARTAEMEMAGAGNVNADEPPLPEGWRLDREGDQVVLVSPDGEAVYSFAATDLALRQNRITREIKAWEKTRENASPEEHEATARKRAAENYKSLSHYAERMTPEQDAAFSEALYERALAGVRGDYEAMSLTAEKVRQALNAPLDNADAMDYLVERIPAVLAMFSEPMPKARLFGNLGDPKRSGHVFDEEIAQAALDRLLADGRVRQNGRSIELAPAAIRAAALSKMLERWKATPVVHYLPFERWDMASYDGYALQELAEQKVTNGVGAIVSIKAIRLNGRLYAGTGGRYHGLRSYFDAWELVPEASFCGETTTRYHDEAAIQAGKRERGDHRGLIVMHRGQRYVFDRKIEVHATLPSPSQAVGVQEAIAHDEQDLKLGWRSEHAPNDIEWKQFGFTVGVFTRRGQDPKWMLYYRDLRGYIRSFYLPEPEALPTVRASDVGNEKAPMAEGKKKRGTKDCGYTLCGELVTNCIDETCNAMRVDWADREVLGQALSRDEDPVTGKPIAAPQRRIELQSELEHLDLSIWNATEYLAQFVEGTDDMAEQKRAAAFKRGDAVMYYGATGPKRMWWGAKMHAYRILASDPADLDAGLTIKEEEVGHTIFHAPNQHGVFVADDAAFTTIEYRKQRSYVRVAYLQVGPEQWVARYSYNYGIYRASGPAHIDDSHPTWTDAVRRPLTEIIASLAQAAATDSSLAIRRFARDAMLGLLAQVPLSLQTTIINEVRTRRTSR